MGGQTPGGTVDDSARIVTAPGAADGIVIIGAGPAGLTAAYQLAKEGRTSSVLEASAIVGGLSATIERNGWRFDIGGHRFITKVAAVRDIWHEVLGPEDFLLRPRLSRIFYKGKYLDYPLRWPSALRALGLVEAIRCLLSYMRVAIFRPRRQASFEDWVSARFGRRLYGIFFKTYTEKVWGVPATEIQADWAAQRIKTLSLSKALLGALVPGYDRGRIDTLTTEFHYPRLGPGMLWERVRTLAESMGATVFTQTRVTRLRRHGNRVIEVDVSSPGTGVRALRADHVVSTMPLPDLVLAMDPEPPAEVRDAARNLRHRDFMTVALVVPTAAAFPDNWIYVHAPEVRVARIQNYGAWSPDLIQGDRTCLGLEYFVDEHDDLWTMSDDDLVEMATAELDALGLLDDRSLVESGYVLRVKDAYPVYDMDYSTNVETLRRWLETEAVNVHPVGRNGLHRYNNQDHSMYTAMLAVENLVGGDRNRDVWAVNMEQDHLEQNGNGRGAPVFVTNGHRDLQPS